MASTSVPNTTREGVQLSIDLLAARQAALSEMIDDAHTRCDVDAIYKLDLRHSEVTGLISALRALLERAA